MLREKKEAVQPVKTWQLVRQISKANAYIDFIKIIANRASVSE